MKIGGFRGQYYFLSNFYPSTILINNFRFENGEAAFHSFKDLKRQSEFQTLDPSTAKRKGRRVQLRADWEQVKDGIMYQIVKAKFTQNKDLAIKLLATGDSYLEETNTWNDIYWGVCNGRGKNRLGEILMEVRREIQ